MAKRFSWLKTTEDLSSEEKEKQGLALYTLRIIFAFMLAVIMIYGGIVTIMGSGLFLPRDAEGVLKSTEKLSYYAWTSESVRQVKLPSMTEKIEQDALRSVVVNTKENKFQSLTVGVLKDKTIMSSDSKFAVRKNNVETQWNRISDVCNNKPTIPANLLEMPGADDIIKLKPQITNDKGTILNQRAWVIDFTPDKQFLKQLFWIPFFEKALSKEEQRWVLSEKEKTALESGQYKIDYAEAWVNRTKPRRLYQYEVKFHFTIPNGSAYRFLVKYNPQTEKLDINFGDPNCNSKTLDINTNEQTTPNNNPTPGGE